MEFEEMLILWKKIFQLAREYDQTKILALLKIKGRIPVRARVKLLFNLKEMGWDRRHRIAAVPLTSQVNKDVRIVEQFMDRIGYNARLFTKEVDALIWLLSDAAGSEPDFSKARRKPVDGC